MTQTSWALDDQTKSTVRSLAVEAQTDYDAGRFEEAQGKFQQALSVLPVPTLCLWAARSLAKTGKLVRAAELYRRAVSLKRNDDWTGSGQERAQDEARSELSTLLPRLGKLRVHLENAPADAVVSINSVSIPPSLLNVAQVVDPGDCEVVVRTSEETKTAKVHILEGGTESVTLQLAKSHGLPPADPHATSSQTASTAGSSGDSAAKGPASGSSAQRTWGWVGVTVGAVGLATGAVGGAFVISQHSEAKACDDNSPSCKDPGVTESYNRWRDVSKWGFIVGGVATAAGVTLLLTAPSVGNSTSLNLRLSPGILLLDGNF